MTRIARWSGLGLVLGALAGCSAGVKEQGPIKASEVPKVNQEEINKQMMESFNKGGRSGAREDGAPPVSGEKPAGQ